MGRYELSKGKADTYSVEADHAELRHDLARLAHSDIASVDPAVWEQIQKHAGTELLRDAINETSREVAFKYSPRHLTDFFALVLMKLPRKTVH